jgi:hypothetical protein
MPPIQPQSPNPNFDFMLNNDQAPKKHLPLPSVNLPKPAKIVLGVVAVIFVLIIASSLLSGKGGGNNQPIVDAIARDQEILRVTNLVQTRLKLQDPQTQAAAATAATMLTSEKIELVSYLKQNHTIVSPAQVAADIDKTTDSSLQTASQNNGLDTAYISYLKASLAKYQADLQAAYKSTGPTGKKLLSNAFKSNAELLKSPPLSS